MDGWELGAESCESNKKSLWLLVEALSLLSQGFVVRPAFGTLLGLYRDGRLIPHDTDIDLNIYINQWEDVEKIKSLVKQHLGMNGYVLVLEDTCQIVFTKYGSLPVDVCIFKQFGNSYLCPHMCGTFELPENVVDNPEVFLVKIYGDDWRTPRRDGGHSERAWLHGDGVTR